MVNRFKNEENLAKQKKSTIDIFYYYQNEKAYNQPIDMNIKGIEQYSEKQIQRIAQH